MTKTLSKPDNIAPELSHTGYHAHAMRSLALEKRLLAAQSNDEWVGALAEFFSAHGLVFGHGTDNAGDEAFWLVRHVQEWRDAAWDAPPDRSLLPRVLDLAERRVEERKPLAYLLGEAWFAGLRFKVDERVLVPRSPLAEVIECGFEPWCTLAPDDRVLDIGTGSGCLAIATALYCPGVRVVATDVSRDALALAADNVALHGVSDRVTLQKADLYPDGADRYRVVLSNPPYVPEHEVADLPPEYRAEPAGSLAGGATGLTPTKRILRGAAERLTDDGVLFVEVGAQAHAFGEAYPELPVIWLEFERGGDGVFVVGAEELRDFHRAAKTRIIR
jgi:ribosomal protein L3 glutamine methyltransferase